MMFNGFWKETRSAAIVNRLWQSTLVMALAWPLTLVLRRNQARKRYWVWGSVTKLSCGADEPCGHHFGGSDIPSQEPLHQTYVLDRRTAQFLFQKAATALFCNLFAVADLTQIRSDEPF